MAEIHPRRVAHATHVLLCAGTIYIYIYIYTCLYIYIYIYIDLERERERDKHKSSETAEAGGASREVRSIRKN